MENSPLHTYRHDHPPVVDVNLVHEEISSGGQKVADRIAAVVGSWPFIITQSCLLVIWIGINVYFAVYPGALRAYDPYPFILLNLALSFQAAYTGPIVLMSQNRQADKDRLVAESDYKCNLTSEEEIRLLMEHLKIQDHQMAQIASRLEEVHARVVAKG